MSDLLASVRGCTFDDFLFSPRFSVLERRDPKAIDLSSKFSEHITLKHPIVSANMDTITRSAMAVVQAEEGGLGVIDRGFRGGEIATQVREVEIVKRTQHGVISDPYTVSPSDSLAEAGRKMQKSGVGTLVVVDSARKLKGLLTARDVRFVAGQKQVAERMTPLENLVVHSGPISLDEAERMMVDRKVKKLPLVDETGKLIGLITAKDIVEQKRLPLATRDAQGRLRVGAAIGAKGDYLERAAELIKAGVDVIVIDIAHGHSVVMAKALEAFRSRFGDFELVAGNVATTEGAKYLAERGVNGIKVGIGPGVAVRRGSTRISACRSFKRSSNAGRQLAAESRSSRMAASSATARSSRRCCSVEIPSCSAMRLPARQRRQAKPCTSQSCSRSHRKSFGCHLKCSGEWRPSPRWWTASTWKTPRR